MAISLKKGEKVSLSKKVGAAGLKKIRVGLGWDVRKTDGEAFDLDASAFLLGAGGKVIDAEKGMVFYGFPATDDGTVKHTGDNKTGQGEGDDECILIDVAGLAANIEKIAFGVTIFQAAKRRQTFGQVNQAYIRVLNEEDGTELTRFDLSEDFSTETAITLGVLYKHNGEWKFEANGQGYAGGLKPLAESYGMEVADDEDA